MAITRLQLNTGYYRLYKVDGPGRYDFKYQGFVLTPQKIIQLNKPMGVGIYSQKDGWITTPVTRIQQKEDGILFNTINSCYLLVEAGSSHPNN